VVDLENNIIAFVNAIRNFLKGLNDSHLNSFPANWPAPNCMARSVSPQTLPILSWMPAAVKAAGKQTEFLVNSLASLANTSPGVKHTQRRVSVLDFLRSMVGRSLSACGGPSQVTAWPAEFYFWDLRSNIRGTVMRPKKFTCPLTGQTLWQRDDQDWAYRAAGLPIYHASGVPHAMRTESVLLLALYLWRGGNLVQKSRIESP